MTTKKDIFLYLFLFAITWLLTAYFGHLNLFENILQYNFVIQLLPIIAYLAIYYYLKNKKTFLEISGFRF